MPPLGARRTPHRRWPRRAARSVLLAAILLPLTVLSTGSNTTALATPTSSARLEDQLDQLNRESDQLVEQYNQSRDALARIRKSLKNLQTQATGAEDEVRKLQASLGARASAAYVQGAGSAVAAVLGSDDPAAAIARVQVLELLAANDGDLMDQLGLAGKVLAARRADLVAAEKAQAAEVKRLEAKKAEVERAADKTRALLARMRAADRPQAPARPSNPVAPPPASGGGGGSGGSGNPEDDPNHLWDILIHSASFSARPDGSSWDPTSGADPYVVVEVNGVEYTTSVVQNAGTSVTWNQHIGTVTTSDLRANGFGLVLLDRDPTSAERRGGPASDPDHPDDDYIASFGSIEILDGQTHTYDISWGGVVGSVTFTFLPR